MSLACLGVGVAAWIVRASLVRLKAASTELVEPKWYTVLLSWIRAVPNLVSWLPAHLLGDYRGSRAAQVLEELQPLSVVIAVLALGANGIGLWLTSQEMERNTAVRENTLRSALDEKLAEAAVQSSDDIDGSSCYVEIPPGNGALARMVESTERLGISLNEIWAAAVPLRHLKLDGAVIEDALFSVSDLSHADFSESNLRSAEFFCARLEFAKFQRALLPSADFRLAYLRDADFSAAELFAADFSGAELSGADFKNASLGGSEWSGARINGADFTEAQGLEKNQITAACICSERNLPKGLPEGWQPQVKRDCPDKE